MMTSTSTTFTDSHRQRSLLVSLVINAVCPLLIYQLVQPMFPADSPLPLVIAGLFSITAVVLGPLRKRQLDIVGLLVLLEIAVSLIVTLLASSARSALIGGALDNTLLGIVYLATLLLPKPLMFFIGRQFLAGNDEAHARRFDRLLSQQYARHLFRGLTLLWGATFLGEAAVRVVLASNLPVATYVAAAPVLNFGIYASLIFVTLRIVRNARPRLRAMLDQSQ